MPDTRTFNVFKTLNEILSELTVGDKIISNGDSGFAQDRYYSGTIKAINGSRVEIARDDGQEGGGDNGEWVIKSKSNSTIKIMLLNPNGGTNVNRARITFGDVVRINEELYLIMEKLPNTRYLVRKFFRHDQDGSLTIDGTGTFTKLMFHFSEIRCQDCDSLAIRSVNGRPYCQEHIREYGNTETCRTCGQTIWRNASYQSGEEGPFYCERCYHDIREQNRAINNYSFKPIPQFISVVPEPKVLEDKIFHGVENEVELGSDYPDEDVDDEVEYDENDEPIERPRRIRTSDRERLAQELKRLANKKRKWLYIKADSSLNNGFELVTEPATVDAHLTLPWDKVCGFYHKNGIIADNTGTCGLHVHVNKNVMNEEAQIKLAYFVATQKKNMEKVARRPACSWALFKDPRTELQHIAKSTAKYEALNWNPSNTVEFRLFKGTVDQHIMMSSIEFTQACVVFTSGQTIDNLKKHTESWKNFVKFCNEKKYKHLCTYLTERGVAV